MTTLSSRAPGSVPGPIVVMGVAGCGKTTIGQLLAGRLGAPYADADSFHPAGNVEKMFQGTPLTDHDRQPWLDAIAGRIRQDNHLVVSCSALKRRYRDILRRADPRTWFLHLVIDRETATARVAGRATHFMPASLVNSQFADLEPLRDETGLAADATRPPEEIITTVLSALARPAPQPRHHVAEYRVRSVWAQVPGHWARLAPKDGGLPVVPERPLPTRPLRRGHGQEGNTEWGR
jgi:gluconokinase